MNYQKLTRTCAILFVAASGWFFYESTKLKHAYQYPRFCLLMITILSVLVFILSLKEEKQEAAEAQRKGETIETLALINKGVILTILLPLVTALFWSTASFLVCSIVMMFALMMYNKCGVIKSLMIAVLVSCFLQWAFYNQFHVRVPTLGFWPK